jgi:hypothetical protein
MNSQEQGALEAIFYCEDCSRQVGLHIWPNYKCRQCRADQVKARYQPPVRITGRRRYHERNKSIV